MGEEIDTSQLSLTVQRGPPTAASGHAHLQIFKDGAALGEVLAGGRDVTVLGRNSKMCHERLDHESISRRHAALVHNGDGDVFAADLGSTHGTYVNGCKIASKTATRLGDGDVIKFGESSRSYVFRLSAPKSVTTKSASSNGTFHEKPTAAGGESGKANGGAAKPRVDPRNSPNDSKAPSSMLPPPGGHVVKKKAEAGRGRPADNWAQPKPVVGRKSTANPPVSGMDSEREAMLQANVPSSFGAARDKPLGKKAVREAHIMRGVPGAVISGTSGRFATGRSVGKSIDKAGSSAGETVDKEEARKQKQAEIAAITAELMAAESSDAAENGNGREDVPAAASSAKFKPGGWRHSSGNGKGDDEEEEITEEMRIKLVVRRLGLPVSHEVQLSGHHKGVTALALDRAGGRVATGSNDYKVKLFDFGGMDKRHLPFREIEPEEGNVVVSISYSGTGHAFLVCTAGSQPKVYDRDGNQLAHFVKGDPYLKNMASTKGHVTRVTGGDWHPTKRNEMLTCSVDGTVRIWNLTGKLAFDNLINQTVIKLRSARALKLGCTAAVYHQEGRRIAAGGEDGSLHLINMDRPHVKHDVVREAHKGCELTSISFNEDGHLLATRAMDDTVKLWDIRKLGGGVVKTFPDVPTHMETANTSFSPDGRVLVCGSNVRPKSHAMGVLKFFNVYTAEAEPELEVNAAPEASVARVVWHAQTNQVICSTSAGGVRVMYDPAISDKGAMLSAGRSHSRLNTNMFLPKHAVGEVYAPHALPMFREEQNSKKRKERSDRKDPVRSKKPDPPMPGRGVQGRISSSNNFHQYVLKEHLVSQKNLLHEDPREELLKYEAETKDEKEYLGSAYEKSQPEGGGMFHRTLEQEEEDFKEEQRKLLDS
ncbi:conserved unknown protein [Ectocarpus siliculosus]|uniref:FHA domain-containing protein n=1 Tax=Ectocarpus siliculosus TaxID=2880 RepID=D7FKU8_ECTSI|nr:conserved unknown protein [Ectocarpus siliculosus]|eukprot:CBJ29493.1 conserved unknown protein [Ectocarpus siliculosus]